MRFYRVNFQHNALANCCNWYGSKREANRRAAELRRTVKDEEDGIDGPISIDEVNVPTDKAALLVWLNDNLATDNG